jgi:hypothetical protein
VYSPYKHRLQALQVCQWHPPGRVSPRHLSQESRLQGSNALDLQTCQTAVPMPILAEWPWDLRRHATGSDPHGLQHCQRSSCIQHHKETRLYERDHPLCQCQLHHRLHLLYPCMHAFSCSPSSNRVRRWCGCIAVDEVSRCNPHMLGKKILFRMHLPCAMCADSGTACPQSCWTVQPSWMFSPSR